MGDTRFWQAGEAERIAFELINDDSLDEFHQWRALGAGAPRLIFVFRDPFTTGDRCKQYANVRKLPALPSALMDLAPTDVDLRVVPSQPFVVQINWLFWQDARDEWKRAVVHHELMHISPANNRLRPHDIEEFEATSALFGDDWKKWREEGDIDVDMRGDD